MTMTVETTAPVPAPPSLGIPVLVWSVLFPVSFVIVGLEVVWIAFLLWLPLCVFRRASTRAGFVVGLGSAVVLVAHAGGYKVLGAAVVVENRPFEPDAHIVAVGPGVQVTLADGRVFDIAGLQERRLADGSGALGLILPLIDGATLTREQAFHRQLDSGSWESSWSSFESDLRWWTTRDGVPVQVIEQGGGKASFRIGTRHHYWCGNTFFPMPFPERLPRYGSQDLAEVVLTRSDAVSPDGSLADRGTQKRLDQIQERRQKAVSERPAKR